jgi:hypothetical protein
LDRYASQPASDPPQSVRAGIEIDVAVEAVSGEQAT